MRIDISHLTLPEDFDEVSDLYIPEEQPVAGVIYPSSQEIYKRPDFNDLVLFLLQEAQKKNKLEFSLELVKVKTNKKADCVLKSSCSMELI